MKVVPSRIFGGWVLDKLLDAIVYLFDLGLRFLESRGWGPRLKI